MLLWSVDEFSPSSSMFGAQFLRFGVVRAAGPGVSTAHIRVLDWAKIAVVR